MEDTEINKEDYMKVELAIVIIIIIIKKTMFILEERSGGSFTKLTIEFKIQSRGFSGFGIS